MCFLTTLLNGNPVSDASEVRHANIWLMIPKVANFLGAPYRVRSIETPRLCSHPLTAAQQRTTVRPPPHGGRVPSRGGPPRAGSMLVRPFMHPGAA